MTVVHYETKFRELEWLAQDIVPKEKKRIEWFYEGLHYEIRMAYLDRRVATLGDLVRAVREAE